jgi:hypothetical protein
MEKTTNKISLRTLLLALITLIFVIPAVVTGVIYTNRMRTDVEHMLLAKLEDRGQISAEQLARRLYRLWIEIATMAETIAVEAPETLGPKLSTILQADRRYSWIGVADVKGDVVAQAGSGLDGRTAANQDWFRRGMQGSYAGEVFLSSGPDQTRASQPARHRIEFAAPVLGSERQVTGVIGAYFDWAWVQDVLESFTRPGTEVVLLSRDRRVLFGPAGMEGHQLQLGSAVAASQGAAVPRIERWPDGEDYLTSIVPRVEHRSMPTFGWSLIVRQKASDAFSSVNHLFQSFWLTFGIGALVALVSIFILVSWLTRSISKLSHYAAALGEGREEGPPPEESAFCEATELSGALARLQSRLKSSPPQLSVVGVRQGGVRP